MPREGRLIATVGNVRRISAWTVVASVLIGALAFAVVGYYPWGSGLPPCPRGELCGGGGNAGPAGFDLTQGVLAGSAAAALIAIVGFGLLILRVLLRRRRGKSAVAG